ncbi:MAG TPA: hypothetical protein VJW73_22475, partial [Gemmatimonadaceae bacterium]|nr:hypothetical protein [Gemmatimonadaceae bacterium]
TALIALTTTACTSWHVQPGPAPSAVEAKGGSNGAVRLMLRGGAFADVYNPQIVGDSIIAMSAPASAPTRERVAFATADVESVATKQVNPGRTILALAAIGLAVAIIVGSASASQTTTSSNSSCALLSLPSSTALA